MESCVFCKIIKKEIPAKIIYEDEDALVFPDIHPYKPVHLLIIPKTHIADFIEVNDTFLIAKLLGLAKKMIAREGLKDKGYRVTLNGGGAQLVPHLHIHLMGPMSKTASL